MSKVPGSQDTINIVINETISLLGCDRVSLFVLDRKNNMLKIHASNLSTPMSVSPGQGIAGTVFQTRETVNIPNCYEDITPPHPPHPSSGPEQSRV